MDKFSVDVDVLDQRMSKAKYYLLDDVKDRVKKVAFDVVRFVDSENIDDLWQVQQADDGKQYIVAMYGDGDGPAKSSSDWSVLSDGGGDNVSVFYKNEPVTRVSMSSVGIPTNDAKLVCGFLTKKLASDDSFVADLLNDVPEERRKDLVEKHPELAK
jgi:hypothetical protein